MSTWAATDSFLPDRDDLDLGAANDKQEDLGGNEGGNGLGYEDLEPEDECSDIEENVERIEDGSESKEDPNEDERESADDALGPDNREVDDDEVAGLSDMLSPG